MTYVAVGLAEAIAALREELLAAIAGGEEAPIRFRLAPVDLTLQVAVTKEGDGKIGWKVLEFGGSYTSAITQTLTLRLEPVFRDGADDFMVADQSAQAPAIGPRG